MRKNIFLLLFFFCSAHLVFAQDDLLQMLQDSSEGKTAIIGTFKGTKLINLQTNETIRKKTLDVRISHLFGPIGKESGGSVHTLYGLDQSDDIRIGLNYGITNKIMVGVARSKRFENLEGLVKIKLLEQNRDNTIPVGVTLFANTTWSARNSALFASDLDRFTYCYQLILSRRINSHLSVMINPSMVHRNLVVAGEDNNTMTMAGGLRWKFSPSASLVADYAHTFNNSRPGHEREDVLGLGCEIETGGHIFTIMFSNASGLIENDFLVNTADSWSKGGFKLSFIISRMFDFTKKDKKKEQ